MSPVSGHRSALKSVQWRASLFFLFFLLCFFRNLFLGGLPTWYMYTTADPGGGQRGPWPPQKTEAVRPPKKRKEKKRKEKKRKEKKRKEKKRKEKKKKRGKKRDKTKPHNFTPPPCAAKSCLYVQLLLKYANYNTLIGYMNVFIILLTIQHCHKICNGSLCS